MKFKGQKGMFSKKDIKRMKDDAIKRKRKEYENEKKLQIYCNHRNTKGKNALKETDQKGVLRCKICGMKVIDDPEIINKESLDQAAEVILSAIAIIRHEMSLTENYDKKMINAAMIVAILGQTIEDMNNTVVEKEKDKKYKHDKDKHNKNKHGKKFRRAIY